MRYGQVRYSVSDSVQKLEDEQIETGIGMTRGGENTTGEGIKEIVNNMSAKKHTDNILSHALKLKNS